MSAGSLTPHGRALRIAVGVAMLALGWSIAAGAAAATLRVLALYPLVTGALGWSPLKALLRV